MDRLSSVESEARFSAYVDGLSGVIGHAGRTGPRRDCCLGLLPPEDRKSVEPMAALTAPGRTAARRQSLLHFVGNAPWPDTSLPAKVRELVLPAVERRGPVQAWIVDDTGFPKKGRHSAGVTRQYCGQLGKQDNCQVAATLPVANHFASLPVAYRLYLPADWANDPLRRAKAGVPVNAGFATKPEIALEQIRAAFGAKIPCGIVLMDAGYGADTELRTQITAPGLKYSAGIQPHTSVCPQGTGPLPQKTWSGRGRPTSRTRREAGCQPVQVRTLALDLPEPAWETITWREGTSDWPTSCFARVRVRTAHRDEQLSELRPGEWLMIEWPGGDAAPAKHWLSTLPEDTDFTDMVDLTKLRGRIERDCQDLKQEAGLGHFEGRGWRGFHHHATLCIAACGFPISGRETIPPSRPRRTPQREKPAVSGGGGQRDAAGPARAAFPQLRRHNEKTSDRCPRQTTGPMSVLPPKTEIRGYRASFMT